jgi:hypothetical protein
VPKDFKKGGSWLVKGKVAPDGKTIAVSEMAAQTPTAAELQDNPAPPSTPGAKPYTGTVAHTGAGLPTLASSDKVAYHLKPSKSATTATRHTLTRIGSGDVAGVFTVSGTTYEDDSHHWIVVESIRATNATGSP